MQELVDPVDEFGTSGVRGLGFGAKDRAMPNDDIKERLLGAEISGVDATALDD